MFSESKMCLFSIETVYPDFLATSLVVDVGLPSLDYLVGLSHVLLMANGYIPFPASLELQF